jgi:hypothetical protein
MPQCTPTQQTIKGKKECWNGNSILHYPVESNIVTGVLLNENGRQKTLRRICDNRSRGQNEGMWTALQVRSQGKDSLLEESRRNSFANTLILTLQDPVQTSDFQSCEITHFSCLKP